MPWGRPSCMSRSLTNYTLYYLKKFHNIDDIFIDYFSHISMHVFANCFPYLWLLIRVDACLWRTSSVGFRFLSSCAAGFWDGDAVRAQEEGFIGFIGFIRVSYEFKDKKGGHVWFWSIDGFCKLSISFIAFCRIPWWICGDTEVPWKNHTSLLSRFTERGMQNRLHFV